MGKGMASVALQVLVWMSGLVVSVEGVGKGCIGIWQASDDLVFVSDSDLVGIHVVSLSRGETLERIALSEMTVVGDKKERQVNNAISLSSCQKCNYLLYTQNHGRMYRVFFDDTVEKIVAAGGSFAEGVSAVELVTFEAKKGDAFVPGDARGVLISSSGRNGWIVDGKSDKPGVYKMRIKGKKPGKPILTQRVLKLDDSQGFGVTFAAGSNEEHLWIPTRRGSDLFRLRAKDGKLLERYSLRKPRGSCPNVDKVSKNFRQMYDDPLRPNTLLAIASTSDPWDAAIWMLNTETNECDFLVAETQRAAAWVDGYESDVNFSRSHFMYLLEGDEHRQHPKIIISDIDNRSLRVVDVRTTFTYTIMYDRDRRLQQLQSRVADLDAAFAQDQDAVLPLNIVTNVTAEDAISVQSLGLFSRERDCQSPRMRDILQSKQWLPSVSLLDNTSPVTVIRPKKTKWQEVTFEVAQEYCQDQGFRLCEPAELKRASRDAQDDIFADLLSWTKGECASCWKRMADVECGLPPLPNFRTFEFDHGDNGGKTFFHTWNNGTAYEIGSARLPQGATTGVRLPTSITFCPGTTNQKTGKPLQALAAAVCCVDCQALSG